MTDLQSLLAEITKAPLKTKVAAALVVVAVAGVLGISGMVASRPHYVTLYTGLDDGERVAVEKALAGSGVSFRASQPPGPYTIYVDDGGYDQAQIAVALAEALKRTPSGINANEGGASTIFMSAGERQQSMLKREWQETEHLLQQLDFVNRATVTTSSPGNSPLRAKEPVTVSVALNLHGAGSLTSDEATAVAKLVRYRFGVPAENVIISDQAGHILYDPDDDDGPDARSPLEHAATYDRELAGKVNSALQLAFGERKVLVTVTSEWNYDQSTTISETLDPETVPLSTETRTTKTPQGAPFGPSGAGGAVGTAANLASGFGVDNAAIPGQDDAPAAAEAAETSDEKTVFDAGRSRTQTVRNTPHLARLSVSLVMDESLGDKRDEIVDLVKAAVGFNDVRDDVLGVSTTSFSTDELVPEEEGEGAAAPSAPNPTIELLLTRGVEIVAALGFVVLLFLSLRGGKKRAAKAGAQAAGAPGTSGARGTAKKPGAAGALGLDFDDEDLDPVLVARAQIEELVKTDPRRVGEILSRWANDDSAVGAK